MPNRKLKIVQITSEISPFSKTGGLADVCRSLPKAIKRLGHEVMVITPLYSQTIDKDKLGLELVYGDVKVYINSRDTVKVSFYRGYLMKGLPVYFVECKPYFSLKKNLYGSSHENARWVVFDVSALKLLSLMKYDADIIHCHDRQTGLIPHYLKADFRYSKTLDRAKSVFTIHNLVFQMGMNWWEVPLDKKDYGRGKIPHLDNPDLEYVNFVKRAIISADIINTVSEQYRTEIMTRNFGQDLHRILKNRSDRLFGIVNGIDFKTYNPQNDPGLKYNYDHKSFRRKQINKEFLQKKLGFAADKQVPLLVLTSRVTFQKGFELILNILDDLLKLDLHIIIMGDGEKDYICRLKKYAKNYPDKLAWLPFGENADLETLLYAAGDLFLLPSHHEPCGINQLIAMRYGCIPVVRQVGGLHDTVRNFNPGSNRGTGFTFKTFGELPLYGAIIRALDYYKSPEIWEKLIVRAMNESNSWEIPAKKYINLYKKALKLNGQKRGG